MTTSTDVAARYTALASLYDAWTWATERRSLDAALARAAPRDGEDVLEVAVGTGLLFARLLRANRTGRTVGVDLTPAMLRRARRKAARTGVAHELVVGDARRLAFADASFDLVVNNNMLGLVPPAEVAPIVRELARVVRPGGRVVLVTMTRPRRAVAGAIYELGACRLGGWHDVDVAPAVRAAGLAIAHREVVTQLGIPSEILVATAPARAASPPPPSRAGGG